MGRQNDPSLMSERTVLGRSCTHSCTEQMYTQLYLGTGSEQMYTQLSKCVHTVLIILAIAAESSELDRLSTRPYLYFLKTPLKDPYIEGPIGNTRVRTRAPAQHLVVLRVKETNITAVYLVDPICYFLFEKNNQISWSG